jgi:hypothetical protein
MTKVYVVAWRFNTGGGFDWYVYKADADAAWREERLNAESFASEGWKAYRFEYQTRLDVIYEDEITDEIGEQLDSLCDTSVVSYSASANKPSGA